MLKKVGVVAAAAIGLSILATPAIATADPLENVDVPPVLADGVLPTFGSAYDTVALATGTVGYGASAVVAGAFTGIATTPAMIVWSLAN